MLRNIDMRPDNCYFQLLPFVMSGSILWMLDAATDAEKVQASVVQTQTDIYIWMNYYYWKQ